MCCSLDGSFLSLLLLQVVGALIRLLNYASVGHGPMIFFSCKRRVHGKKIRSYINLVFANSQSRLERINLELVQL
jgi:hypothetical protein